ncbi:response regulator transcription factor [Patescibacteria group bacterium]
MAEGKYKILLVEDDAMISNMYRTKLERDDIIVLTSDNGAQGLEMAIDEKPDLIMLDVILPQLDGFAVLQELKQNGITKHIPVIMLTNLGTDEDKDRGERSGASDYWVKSNLTPTEVSEKIKKYLHKE